MVHTATLVHDDIIDAADTRRGRPSANTTWGNSQCVLAGDWLYMQAFRVALEERNFKVLDLLIGLTQQMVEGEFVQIENLGRMVSEAEYYDLIYRKTACLFRVSMRLGAVLAESAKRLEEQLGEYGRNLGVAFQIVDDVLDLTASEEDAGQAGRQRSARGQGHPGRHPRLGARHAGERAAIDQVLADSVFERSHTRRFWRSSIGTARSTTRSPPPIATPNSPARWSPICRRATSAAPCSGCRTSSSPATSNEGSIRHACVQIAGARLSSGQPHGSMERTRRRGQTPLRGSRETGSWLQQALVAGNVSLRHNANQAPALVRKLDGTAAARGSSKIP